MIIASDNDYLFQTLSRMLEGYECPAILVSADYQILATNDNYKGAFGEIELASEPKCYQISHGYNVPCDQAGEDCPLKAATASRHKERVLHIHQTPRGKEHVDVEMLPILDKDGNLAFFIELLKPVPLASGQIFEHELVGSSKPFNNMLEAISRVATTDASTLLLGESGTGKELAARAIHLASERKNKAMVTLECAGLTESLFESELFGHIKGAFTGALSNKKGLVEIANGGTLFLDEIGDVPIDLQVKLLRLIESGTYRPVGSAEVKTSDFRLICATHKDLETLVEQGLFRQDLYYRINVFPILLPSLQDRREDIPQIAHALLSRLDKKQEYILTESAMHLLVNHYYKGNIRELRNILHRAIVFADTNVINKDVISKCIKPGAKALKPKLINKDLKTLEKDYLKSLMEEHKDKRKVAQIAGISLRSLYRKLEE